MRRAIPALLVLAGGCAGPPPEIPLGGLYRFASFHLVLDCGSPPTIDDLLYPEAAYSLAEDERGFLSLRWDGVPLAYGYRQGNQLELFFHRRDPFGPELSPLWHFRGLVRDDLSFHQRTIAGNLDFGSASTGEGRSCPIAERSVAWMTTEPTGLSSATALSSSRFALSGGDWNRFLLFFQAGPLPITNSTGGTSSISFFSLAATGGGSVTAGDSGAFFDNGLPEPGGGPHIGDAIGLSAAFPMHDPRWSLEVAQDELWSDGLPGRTSPGVRRVLAGFLSGSMYVAPSFYPPGWSGPTGLVPLSRPGMAIWLDEDPGP